MEFDPTRPCSSKTRQSNRYRRTELQKIAESLNVNQGVIQYGTINQLCNAIREKHSLKAASSPQPIVTSPTAPPCLFDISRPCGQNGPKKYSFKELKDLWKNECQDLQEFAGKKPKTIKDFCGLLMNRYINVKFVALKDVPEKAKDLLKKWASKVSSSLVVTNKTTLTLTLRSVAVRTMGGPREVVRTLVQNPILFTKNVYIGRPSYFGSYHFRPLKAKTDPTYLYNKNVDRFPHDWFREQNDYVLGLSWRDKVRLLSYTYAGDKICNSFLLGTLCIANIVDSKFLSTYHAMYLFPLALDFYLNARTFASYEKWKAFCVPLEGGSSTTLKAWQVYKEDEARFFFADLGSKPFDDVYNSIVAFFNDEGKTLNLTAWYLWVGEYILHLNAIFAGAPPVPKGGFYVYRGVTDASYVNANKKNVFVNETFMSTSLDIAEAVKFKHTGVDPCCLFSIQVLPGARCLLAGALTYFADEIEILFAPGRHLFITKNQFTASNKKLSVTKFTLTN